MVTADVITTQRDEPPDAHDLGRQRAVARVETSTVRCRLATFFNILCEKSVSKTVSCIN
jgi:hypothetical protein